MLNYIDEIIVDNTLIAADEYEAYCRDMAEMQKIEQEAINNYFEKGGNKIWD